VRFPLADWIDDHLDCRHNLGTSGMVGTVRHPWPSRREIRTASAETLTHRLAAELHVGPDRVFLAPGATEANAWVTQYVGHRRRGTAPTVRVRYPEYPPLVDAARWTGFRVRRDDRPTDFAVLSLPRNPEGVLWTEPAFEAWRDGARSVLVDETFRPFAGTPSVAVEGRRGVWATGSFTKFYAADDVRVGFAVAPPEATKEFARFHGVVTNELTPFSVAAALAILDAGPALPRQVRRVLERNRQVLARHLPGGGDVRAPVYFDRVPDGDRLAARCLRASVLVCPGSYFGERTGVRLTLTRRSFPRDLAAYLAVRGPADGGRSARRSRA
jgi:histidinol-phosphate/aromatic aminotransferase/cobyric acid decarboxylase-like protein